eukprot:3517686-Rhodomonas_salina.1
MSRKSAMVSLRVSHDRRLISPALCSRDRQVTLKFRTRAGHLRLPCYGYKGVQAYWVLNGVCQVCDLPLEDL